MRKLTPKSRAVGTSTVAVLAVLTGITDALSVKGQVSQPAAAQPALGSVTGNEYSNESIGMTYVFPKGWFVDTATMAATNESVKKYVASHDQSGRFKDYQGSTWLMVSKSPERVDCDSCSSIHISGPSITLSGSAMDSSDEHKTGADIQNAIKGRLEDRGGFHVVRGPTEFLVSGQSFSRMDMTNGPLYHGDAIAIRNHVRVEFQFVAETAEQLEDLYKTLNTLEFKP